jgi:hypothetical protein
MSTHRLFTVMVSVLSTIVVMVPSSTKAAAVLVQNTVVPTSDDLERRDQPVTSEDRRILQRANRGSKTSSAFSRWPRSA